jgi:outer membrane protein OmpA-like peptidoglycan-associated protein
MRRLLALILGLSLSGLALLTGCATTNDTTKGAVIGGVGGAALGAGVGAIIGNQQADQNKGRAQGALIGAAAGSLLGSGVGMGIGAYMDKQKRDMEAAKIKVQKQEDNTLLVTLAGDSLKFDSGKSSLKPEGVQQLASVSAILKKYPEDRILISGHTDNVGKKADNQTLSQQRAETVKNTFLGQGVQPASILSATGYGDSQPVADNKSEAGRAQNRRVELRISAPDVK